MGQSYHPGQRELQDRFDSRRLADRLDEAASDRINEDHRRFIEARDMFFLATADGDGTPQCSYKGGDPGFVRVVDERTIAFPSYDGNGMFLSLGNVLANPAVGLLFVDFTSGSRLRLNGTATVTDNDPLMHQFDEAQLMARVQVNALFANCRRYVHRLERTERSPFVPSSTSDTPVPDWKRDPWFEGTLPQGDPALDPAATSAPAIPQF